MAHYESPHLDLLCLQIQLLPISVLQEKIHILGEFGSLWKGEGTASEGGGSGPLWNMVRLYKMKSKRTQ